MIYWQLGIRNGSMCNESDVSERAVANPETIQKGIWEVTILVHPKAQRRAVSVHFPCLNISNPKYIRINNLSLVLSKGMELGSDTAHSC
jgi:hypothetical protein